MLRYSIFTCCRVLVNLVTQRMFNSRSVFVGLPEIFWFIIQVALVLIWIQITLKSFGISTWCSNNLLKVFKRVARFIFLEGCLQFKKWKYSNSARVRQYSRAYYPLRRRALPVATTEPGHQEFFSVPEKRNPHSQNPYVTPMPHVRQYYIPFYFSRKVHIIYNTIYYRHNKGIRSYL